MTEALRHIDQLLFYFINQTIANPFLDFICVILRGKGFLFFCYCLLAAYIYKLYPRHFFKIAIAGAATFLLTDQFSANLVKSIFQRIRPCNNPEIHTRLLLEHCGSGFSFVSAHAANSFGMAAFVSSVKNFKWQTVLVMGAWASLVAFSQVYVGVHFPADVIGGAILGMVIGATAAFILKIKFGPLTTNS